MLVHWRVLLAIAVCLASLQTGLAQVQTPTILRIDVENLVQYVGDTADPSKFATIPNLVAPPAVKNFGLNLSIGDIVAVNGQPAKGTMTRNSRVFNLTPSPIPGQAIADGWSLPRVGAA